MRITWSCKHFNNLWFVSLKVEGLKSNPAGQEYICENQRDVVSAIKDGCDWLKYIKEFYK